MRFPLTYPQRCEAISTPASCSRSKHSVVNGIWNRVFPVPHTAFSCCRHELGPNQLPKLLGRLILIGVNLFSIQTAEPALNHDIICLAALPIHTFPDLKTFQQSLVLCVGKLTPLIEVQDSRNSMHCYRFFERSQG